MSSAADAGRAPRVAASTAIAEVVLTAIEVGAMVMPVLLLGRAALAASGLWRMAAPVAASLWALAVVRMVDRLTPVLAAERAKRSGQAISAETTEAAQKAFAAAPSEAGLLRAALWTLAVGALAGLLAHRGVIGTATAVGATAVALVNAAAAGALRALVLERLLESARRLLLPNLDPLRAFAATYRGRLRRTALALFGAAYVVVWALGMILTDLRPAGAALLGALLLPALPLPALFWLRSLKRRTHPIERYLDLAIRAPSAGGPARNDPVAVDAFRAAQSLPYRLSAYQAFGFVLLAVFVIALGRGLVGFDAATAGRLLAATGLTCLAGGLYEIVLLRRVLAPLLGQLGARHRLPVGEVRSPLGLRPKLIGFFAAVNVFACGFILLFAYGPARAPAPTWASAALGIALALGLVVLVVRDIVNPIHALEARTDEMARGELARPVPPAGEADEIGRLTFTFEEMRRALRDKLRSTESINVDLEREVRRRTEAQEQRAAELRQALEKLRRAQDDLVRTEKLASMGRLVAGIAHEINNPVNAIINTLGPLDELLSRFAAAEDGRTSAEQLAEAQEMLRVIQRGSARTKAIVQALHNYSRGDEETLREVSLLRSIDDTLDLLRHRLKGIRVVKDVDPSVRITGFAGQIDQVLMNLVTNAVQAVGERGGEIHIGIASDGDQAVLTVRDDGAGIPAEILPRIFDPFFTTKDVGEGSGLGLSIVHGIVERHGGRIDVESVLGQGTTFRVVLPRHATAKPGPTQPAS